MSTTDLTMAPSTVEQPLAPESQVRVGLPWARVVLACLILAAAGGLRWWQEKRVQATLESGRTSPFPLKELPQTLGSWQVPEGREETLDPEVARVTGCVDYVKRHYMNEQTGVGVELLVLYGPSTIAHRPEVCYPGAGYQLVDGPRQRTFPTPQGGTATFLSLIFAKGEGGAVDRQQVFYAIRYDRHWTDQVDFKKIARIPGLYKVQLMRRVGESELVDISKPCESFLEALLPELERRISGRSSQ